MRLMTITVAAVIASFFFTAAQAVCSGVLPGSSPLLTRWPYILSVTESSAVVAWGSTRDARYSFVRLTPSLGGAELIFGASGYPIEGITVDVNLFTAKVTSLRPNTEYCYNVFVNTTNGVLEVFGGLSFKTAPSANSTETVKFLAIGDFGCGTPAQRRVRDSLFSKIDQSDMFLALGDDVYMTGTNFAYQRFNFEVYNELWSKKPLYLTSGNHDYYANGAKSYLENFPQFMDQESVPLAARGRYFSWDWGMVHFVSVDTEQELDKPADLPDGQIKWLEADLAKTNKPWKIVILHKVPYTENRVADDRVIEKLNPLFEKYGVQVVLGGHWHDYERYPPLIGQTVVPTSQGGVTYIVTGGGGFPIIGDIIPLKNEMGFIHDANAVSHNIKDDFNANARAVIPPLVYKAVHHFVHVEINTCTFHLQAIDTSQQVIDDFSLNRCQ